MRDEEIDMDRVRERVKRRLQRRTSPLGWIFWIVIFVMIASWLSRPWSSGMSIFPGSSSAWLVFAVVMYLAWRYRVSRRSTSSRAMPSEEEIARAVSKELRHERKRIMRNAVFGSPARWSEVDDELNDGAELYEKPKRTSGQSTEQRQPESVVRLGDDGELIFDDEEQASRRGQR